MSANTLNAAQLANLKDIIYRCLSCVNKTDKIVSVQRETDFSKMVFEHKNDNVTLTFSIERHAGASDAQCLLEVSCDQEVVLKVIGDFLTPPCSVVVEFYIPGDWENKIPPQPN